MSRKPATNRRVDATERALHEALIELVREKDYDEIPVRDILTRAGVGRSTFYAHYDGKDALLASGIEAIIGPADGLSITSFSLPLFEHHDRHRHTGAMSRKARALLHRHLRISVAERIRSALERSPSSARTTMGATQLVATFVASTFVIVLDWWLDTRSTLSAVEVNELFTSLVAPALAPKI